jgi:hypothetical protein
MKAETLVAKDWDDLVFENRNKEYGAYEVRKAYSGNLVAGFAVSIGIALLVFLIPIIISLMGGDVKKIVEAIPKLSGYSTTASSTGTSTNNSTDTSGSNNGCT